MIKLDLNQHPTNTKQYVCCGKEGFALLELRHRSMLSETVKGATLSIGMKG